MKETVIVWCVVSTRRILSPLGPSISRNCLHPMGHLPVIENSPDLQFCFLYLYETIFKKFLSEHPGGKTTIPTNFSLCCTDLLRMEKPSKIEFYFAFVPLIMQNVAK